jgi:hypothetical protein
MTPTEKADQLIAAFCEVIPIEALISDTAEEASRKMDADYKAAKECALIAVEEILNISYFTHDPTEDDLLYMNYFQQVKEALNKK